MDRKVKALKNPLFITILSWLVIAILSVGVVGAISFQVEALTFRYPLDYGEAPLINQAVQINQGQSIYQSEVDQAPYTITNYPPVYVLFLSIFENFFGSVFWYGRLISILSALGSSILIILITYSRSQRIELALIPGMLFLNLPYVVGWSTLTRIDHLALFFALFGLFFLFRRPRIEDGLTPSFILGGLCLVLAIYTRQSYALAAPMAGFLYLFNKRWKKGLLLMLFVGGLSGVLFLLINVVTQGGFYFNIVTANINPFGFERLLNNFRDYFKLAPWFFVLGALSFIVLFRRVSGWILPFVFTIGGFLSALTIGKIGSNVNYFLEFSAGLCLLIGFGLIALQLRAKNWLIGGTLCIVLLITGWQGFQLSRYVQNETRNHLQSRKNAIDDLTSMENLVAQNLEQPILADEYMGMIVLNGKQLYLQPFEITQLIHAGLFDQQKLIDLIKDEEFSLILLQEGEWWSHVLQERWTPEVLEAIRAHYRVTAHYEQTFVYQPRTRHQSTLISECENGVWALPTTAYLGYRYRDGLLAFYGAGAEGQVPVKAVADGLFYRLEGIPEGSFLILHEDPLNPGEKLIAYYGDMRSYQGDRIFISEAFLGNVQGVSVSKGETIGFQGMWSGSPNQQDWLHITFGLAPYDSQFLEEPDLLFENLIDPSVYFGIEIDTGAKSVKPIKCLP